MTKSWNVLAVVMLLGTKGIVANPLVQIGSREVPQVASSFISQMTKGVGTSNGPLRQTGVNLEGKKIDVSSTLSDTVDKNALEEVQQNVVAEIQNSSPADTAVTDQAASTIDQWKAGNAVSEETGKPRSTDFNKNHILPSRQYVMSFFKKNAETPYAKNLHEQRVEFEGGSEQAEFLDAKIEEAQQDFDRAVHANKSDSYKNKFAVAGGLGAATALGAGLYKWFVDNAEENLVVNTLEKNPEAVESDKTESYKDRFAVLLTKKNAAITAGVIVGVAALYKLWSMFTKPSFDQLVIIYLDETTETNPQEIVEQFCSALRAYGYTSKTYEEKAIEVLQEKGFVEV